MKTNNLLYPSIPDVGLNGIFATQDISTLSGPFVPYCAVVRRKRDTTGSTGVGLPRQTGN